MRYNTFASGFNYNLLKNPNNIKLLICYIFFSAKQSLNKEDITNILNETGLTNYFEASSAFESLLKNGSIKKVKNKYYITESGVLIANQLDSELPVSIREKAINTTLNFLAKIKREKENFVKIEKTKNGYNVICNISGGVNNLMSFSIYAPDRIQADFIKKNFQADPELFYKCFIALSTKNKEICNEVAKQLAQNPGEYTENSC